MMRKRKRFHKKFKRSKSPADFENYKHIKTKTIAEIRKSKQLETDKLAAKLRSNDIGPRGWWKILKHFIKPDHSASLPPLYKDDIVYTEEADKATLMNDFFVGQTMLDESKASLPPGVPMSNNNQNLSQLHLLRLNLS